MTVENTGNDTETSAEDDDPGVVTVEQLDTVAAAAVGALETARALSVVIATHGTEADPTWLAATIKRAQDLAYAALEHLGVLEELAEIRAADEDEDEGEGEGEDEGEDEDPHGAHVTSTAPILSELDRAYLAGGGSASDRRRLTAVSPGRSVALDAMFTGASEQSDWDGHKDVTLIALRDRHGAWWGFRQYDLHEEVSYDDHPLFPINFETVAQDNFTRVERVGVQP